MNTQSSAASILDCLDDRCLFITRHQSILFWDWLNLFFMPLAVLLLNYWRNENENKHPEILKIKQEVCYF